MRSIASQITVASLLAGACHAAACPAKRSEPSAAAASPTMGGGMMGGMMGAGTGRKGMMSSEEMGAMRELMAWINGAELSGTPTEPRPQVDAPLLAEGRRLYGERCAVCHGEMHGTAMLPWVSLSERERWALVADVEAFSPRFAASPPPSPIAVPAPPPEAPALAEQGRSVYQRMRCASCHGIQGHGDGPSAPSLRDDSGQPIRLRDLTLHTGLDGSPMPSYDGALTPADTWALAAYVRSLIEERPADEGMMCPMMGGNADPQESLGMMIDMPGMPSNRSGMRTGR